MATTVDRDSLIRMAKKTTDKKVRATIYRDLADLYLEKPEAAHYLRLLYESAKEMKDKELILETLKDIAYSFQTAGNVDSVYFYMHLIKKEVDAQTENKYLSIIRMKLFDSRVNKGKKEVEEALDFELNLFKNADKADKYIQIEKEYVSGSGLSECQNYKEAAVHFEQAYKLAEELSDSKDMPYRIVTGWLYANNFRNVGSPKKCIELLEGILKSYKTNYENNYSKKRPYYNIERSYLQCYASLLMLADALPEK